MSSTNRTEEKKKKSPELAAGFFGEKRRENLAFSSCFSISTPNFTDLEKESLISRALPVLAVIFHVISGGCIRGRKALAVMLFLSLRFLHYTVVVVVFLAKKNSRPATAERQRERLVVSHRIGQVGSKKKTVAEIYFTKKKDEEEKKKKFLTHWK